MHYPLLTTILLTTAITASIAAELNPMTAGADSFAASAVLAYRYEHARE